MPMMVLSDPDFSVCQSYKEIVSGLTMEARKKRIPLSFLPDHAAIHMEPAEMSKSALIFIGSTLSWLSDMISFYERYPIKLMIITAQSTSSLAGEYSSICANIQNSVPFVLAYLKSLGREKVALYGFNPDSWADIGKRERFLNADPTRDRTKDVFENKGYLADCYASFIPRVQEYDAIICMNDYVAMSLIQRLKKEEHPYWKQLYVVSYTDTMLSKCYSPMITSISANYSEFGKCAVSIFQQLQKKPYLSSIRMNVSWTITVSETTGNQPFRREGLPQSYRYPPLEVPEKGKGFFVDPEIADMLKIEKLLSQCDAIDITLLRGLLHELPYSRIGEMCFLSSNGIRYRLNKIFSICEVKSKSALISLLKKYVSPDNFESYFKSFFDEMKNKKPPSKADEEFLLSTDGIDSQTE